MWSGTVLSADKPNMILVHTYMLGTASVMEVEAWQRAFCGVWRIQRLSP